MDGELQHQHEPVTQPRRWRLLSKGYTVSKPFPLLDLGHAPVAVTTNCPWWTNPELHQRCLGDREPFYYRYYREPHSIVARFSQPIDRRQAAEMLQLGARCQIIVEALPGWGQRPQLIIWRRAPQLRLPRV